MGPTGKNPDGGYEGRSQVSKIKVYAWSAGTSAVPGGAWVPISGSGGEKIISTKVAYMSSDEPRYEERRNAKSEHMFSAPVKTTKIKLEVNECTYGECYMRTGLIGAQPITSAASKLPGTVCVLAKSRRPIRKSRATWDAYYAIVGHAHGGRRGGRGAKPDKYVARRVLLAAQKALVTGTHGAGLGKLDAAALLGHKLFVKHFKGTGTAKCIDTVGWKNKGYAAS